MRRLVLLAARLYPAAWRARYGDEFEAMLEDLRPGWRDLLDVLGGATMERIRVSKRELGLTAGVAALGALVAFGLSFTVPTRYQSAATVSLAGMSRERVAQLAGEVSSRTSLSWKISKLEMYRDEAKRMPIEDVIAGMQRRDLRVIAAWPPRPDGSLVVRILFSYPDPVKSEAMVRSFVTAIEDRVRYRRVEREQAWRSIWPGGAPANAENVVVLDRPALLGQVAPPRWSYAGVGLLVGFSIAVFGLLWYRRRTIFRRAIGYGVAGLTIGLAIAYLVPSIYTSTAVIQLTPALIPEDPRAATPVANPDRLRQLVSKVQMDGIRLVYHGSGLTMQTTAPEPRKAQMQLQSGITELNNANQMQIRARCAGADATDVYCKILMRRMGENLEVLDPPSLPQSPSAPNRLLIVLLAVGFGLVAAIARELRREPKLPSLA